MKRCRRQFLHLAAGAAALPAVSGTAWAQAIKPSGAPHLLSLSLSSAGCPEQWCQAV